MEKSEVEGDLLRWAQSLTLFAQREVEQYIRGIEQYCEELHAAGDSEEEVFAKMWDSEGGYAHPQPGSRLAMCGK